MVSTLVSSSSVTVVLILTFLNNYKKIMEVTNDRLMAAFTVKVPLRAFLVGSKDLLVEGKPAVAFALTKYTSGLIQVFESGTKGEHKAVRVMIRQANSLQFDFTVKSLVQINNLELDDSPEVKVIKHILKNDEIISPAFRERMRND